MPWGGWEPLGGVLLSPPLGVCWGPDRIDIFAVGTDNAMWHRWWDGNAWGGWESLGGMLGSPPVPVAGDRTGSTCSRSARTTRCGIGGGTARLGWVGEPRRHAHVTAGRRELGGRPPRRVRARHRRALWHRWWDGTSWGGWESLGGILTSHRPRCAGGRTGSTCSRRAPTTRCGTGGGTARRGVGGRASAAPHVPACRRELGGRPPRRVRARHRQRAVAPVVGRFVVGWVGEPRRHPHVRTGGGVLGVEPYRRVREGHRQRDVAPVVGRHRLGWVGRPRRHPHVPADARQLVFRSARRARERHRQRDLAPVVAGRRSTTSSTSRCSPSSRRTGAGLQSSTSVDHFSTTRVRRGRSARVVNAELGQTTCCANGSTSQCNQPWYLERALTRVGNLDHWVNGTITLAVGRRARSTEGASSVCVSVGAAVVATSLDRGLPGGGNGFVYIEDPIYGASYVDYNTFRTAYQGSGSWTHTYLHEELIQWRSATPLLRMVRSSLPLKGSHDVTHRAAEDRRARPPSRPDPGTGLAHRAA